jgi:hypothetical protein
VLGTLSLMRVLEGGLLVMSVCRSLDEECQVFTALNFSVAEHALYVQRLHSLWPRQP